MDMFQDNHHTPNIARRISIKRISHFNAAHRLNVSHWTAKQNEVYFGKCNNEHYHGHNYKIEVCVSGILNPESGYLMDLKILQNIIDEEIIEPWDHKNLNLQVQEFKELNPTAENIAIVAYEKIKNRIDKKLQLKIILHETERNSVEYQGE